VKVLWVFLLALASPWQLAAHTTITANRQARANAVTVETELFGPVQIQIRNRQTGQILVERVLNGPGRFEIDAIPASAMNHLSLLAVPGQPAKADDSLYRKPFSAYADWSISQGFHGLASHTQRDSVYAVDFALLIGTPVRASRSGIVMQAIDSFPDKGGLRQSDLDNANLVRIRHEDGSMAVYGHLMQDSITVKPGQWVAAGSAIGQSGNSGYSHGPHLHFVVQVNSGMQLDSVPFIMRDENGEVMIQP
jgi:murein DD-endopeptidase MepM/ murein hydrolase activator NlpD